MKIHHGIVKQAAAKGVVLTSDDDAITAHHIALNIRVTRDLDGSVKDQQEFNELARDAWNDAQSIADHNTDPANGDTKIKFEDGDFVAYHDGDELARDPCLEDLLVSIGEALVELGGGEEADDEGEEGGGSVVPAKYKQMYAERGDATTCGDWLALTINGLCHVLDGKKKVTDYDRLETIATANGVDVERVDRLGTATNGWQGRYRMTVRNMLTPLVAAKGFLFVPEGCGVKSDTEKKAPKEWCREHSPKPAAAADTKKAKAA